MSDDDLLGRRKFEWEKIDGTRYEIYYQPDLRDDAIIDVYTTYNIMYTIRLPALLLAAFGIAAVPGLYNARIVDDTAPMI